MQLYLPPWLTRDVNPADEYAKGLQIGSEIGSRQAAQQLAQENAARLAQRDNIEQEIEKAKMFMASDVQARKYAAQQGYQQFVDGGGDPIKALLKYGPGMGLEGGALNRAVEETANREPSMPTVETRNGESYLRTGPHSWEHVRASKPEKDSQDFHNSDGTVTRVFTDGTTKTLGTPISKSQRSRVKVSFAASDLGPAMSGYADDPEIQAREKAITDKAAKDAADSKANEFHPIDWMLRKAGLMSPAAPAPPAIDTANSFAPQETGPAPAPMKKYRFDPSAGKIVPVQENDQSLDDEETDTGSD